MILKNVIVFNLFGNATDSQSSHQLMNFYGLPLHLTHFSDFIALLLIIYQVFLDFSVYFDP